MGLWLVAWSLEQQEGALSYLVSQSSSDNAQPFSPRASCKPESSQGCCPPGLDEAVVQH